MYLILKRDLIHPYLDKSKTRILRRREYEFMCFDVPKEFRVPDEIGDMMRSLEMVKT